MPSGAGRAVSTPTMSRMPSPGQDLRPAGMNTGTRCLGGATNNDKSSRCSDAALRSMRGRLCFHQVPPS